MLTDLKHVLWQSPLRPTYRELPTTLSTPVPAVRWVEHGESIACIGFEGPGFYFDNEGPKHRELVPAFAMASRLVTNGDFQAFIADGGYNRPELWLAAGWDAVQTLGLQAPLYWDRETVEGDVPDAPFGGVYGRATAAVAETEKWHSFTLSGYRPVDPNEPVSHVCYFEADAYARWAGARLPSEAEWEVVAGRHDRSGNFADGMIFHPQPMRIVAQEVEQLYGDVWEWTHSPYSAYPGYRPAAGALGEYNGKFMCNQFVLRGGSCATHSTHIRASYRNFFPPDARWQFSGIRLAMDMA